MEVILFLTLVFVDIYSDTKRLTKFEREQTSLSSSATSSKFAAGKIGRCKKIVVTNFMKLKDNYEKTNNG